MPERVGPDGTSLALQTRMTCNADDGFAVTMESSSVWVYVWDRDASTAQEWAAALAGIAASPSPESATVAWIAALDATG